MRISAYYQTLTPSVMRRIVGPFSVLAQRGHHTQFSFLTRLRQLESVTADVIVLPNWSYPGKLPPITGVYIYDLTDTSYLDDPDVLNVLGQCAGGLAATDAIEKRMRVYCPQVKLAPSLVWKEWVFDAPPQKQQHPYVACLGPFDWGLAIPALRDYLKECTEVRIKTDSAEVAAAFERRAEYIQPDPANYAQIIRNAMIGLVPGRERTTDPGIIFEYSLCGTLPVVGPAWAPEVGRGNAGIIAGGTESLAKALIAATKEDRKRGELAAAAQGFARRNTVIRGADAWLTTVGKLCPNLMTVRTLT